MKGEYLVRQAVRILPQFDDFKVEEINRDIYNYFSLFTREKSYLVTSLIQNPFGKTVDLEGIKNRLNADIHSNIDVLNRLHDSDQAAFGRYGEIKPLVNLFLINYKFLFEGRDKYPALKKSANGMLGREKLEYAMALLEKSDVSELRDFLEDGLFFMLNPKIFNHYSSILYFNREVRQRQAAEFERRLKEILKQEGISSEVTYRFKSIYSIHKKIIKKNISHFQVLDGIGFRIVAKTKADCYKIMNLIVSNWRVSENRIKDYIAVPKDNNYQSIHLTVLIDEYPLEIQIRTHKMHEEAQYGASSHLNYKNGE